MLSLLTIAAAHEGGHDEAHRRAAPVQAGHRHQHNDVVERAPAPAACSFSRQRCARSAAEAGEGALSFSGLCGSGPAQRGGCNSQLRHRDATAV